MFPSGVAGRENKKDLIVVQLSLLLREVNDDLQKCALDSIKCQRRCNEITGDLSTIVTVGDD